MKAGEWTLRSRRVVTPSGTRAADISIRNETIVDLADYKWPDSEGVILDVGDLVVLPGLVALHMVGPARPDPQMYEIATQDAGSGGVTTIIDLSPDHDPESNSPSAFKLRMDAAEGKIRVDCGLVVGLGRGNADLVEYWVESGVIGVEASLGPSGPGSTLGSTEADLRAAMPTLARLGRPLLVHLERPESPGATADGSGRFGSSLPDRDFGTLRLLIRLCRESGCRVHLIRPTASEALPMIAQARAEGLPLTVETCPRHLNFAVEEVVDGIPPFPPTLRNPGPDDRERLWEGLRSGLIDAIGSDHPRAFAVPKPGPPGEVRPARRDLTSLRFALPAVWTEARRQGFTVDDLARWMAGKTAEAFGLVNRKGSIARGLDADFVVFDPDADFIADPDPNRGHPSPLLDGRTMTGQVEATILRGSLIYQGGRFHDHPKGTVVLRFEETLPMHGTAS